MGRTAYGVRGISLRDDDEVVAMEVLVPGGTILSVTEQGYGKRTALEEYRVQSRGGLGIINIQTSDRNGKVVGITQVGDDDELMLITQQGKILRMASKGIRTIGRATQGVRLIDIEGDDRAVSIARSAERDEDETAAPDTDTLCRTRAPSCRPACPCRPCRSTRSPSAAWVASVRSPPGCSRKRACTSMGVDAQPRGRRARSEAVTADLESDDGIEAALDSCDAVLSCLPYRLNRRLAAAAHARGIHYFDLTEDVATTRAVIELGATARGVMAPAVRAGAGIHRHRRRRAGGRVRDLPLPAPPGRGVAAEPYGPHGLRLQLVARRRRERYLNDCEVIEDGVRKWVSSMEWHEPLYVEGVALEAFTTSGGLGHDLRDASWQGGQHRLQDHPLPRSHAA